jgi:hypoxanthine phosphoribosyltransferase
MREPASLEVCVLLNKPGRRLIDIPLKYKGFDIPDRLVVGCGLDFRERYRNLPFVGLLKPEAFQEEVG